MVGYFAFNQYLCDLFSRDIFQPYVCSRGTLGGGAGGNVCLNGRGLKPVSGYRDTGAVNRALMKGQCQLIQAKLGQILKFIFYKKNMPILYSFLSGFQKCWSFLCMTIKMIASQNVASSHLLVFYHCTTKIEILLLKFGKCVACI